MVLSFKFLTLIEIVLLVLLVSRVAAITKMFKNILIVFIFLEMIVLINFFLLRNILLRDVYGPLFSMVIFTLAVCEAGLALRMLVKIIRKISSTNLPVISHIRLTKPLAFKAEII